MIDLYFVVKIFHHRFYGLATKKQKINLEIEIESSYFYVQKATDRLKILSPE